MPTTQLRPRSVSPTKPAPRHAAALRFCAAAALGAVLGAAAPPALAQRSLPGPPPQAPPGFAPVLAPSPEGGYWVLMPVEPARRPVSDAPYLERDAPYLERDELAPRDIPLRDTPQRDTPLRGAPSLGAEPNTTGSADFAPSEGYADQLDTFDIERATLDAINAQRAAHDLPPLQPFPNLETAARGHSEEMARLDYMSHDSPTPGRKDFTDRLRLAGMVEFGKAGENIQRAPLALRNHSADQVAQALVDAWMDSEGHRKNILDEDYVFTGIGAVWSARGIYATQLFASKAVPAETEAPAMPE